MDVGLALRNSPKGQLIYDRHWATDGRAKEVIEEASYFARNRPLLINLKVLDTITKNYEEKPFIKEKDEVDPTPPVQQKAKEKDQDAITDAYFYEVLSETVQPILEYEEDRMKYIRETFTKKRCEFDNHSWELQLQIKQIYLLSRRENELDAKTRAAELQKIEEEGLQEARENEMRLQELHSTHPKKISAKVLEAEMKQKKAEEALRKKQQEQVERRNQLAICLQEARNLVSKSTEKLSSCEYRDHLRISVADRNNQMTKIIQDIESLIKMAETQDLTIDNIFSANRHVHEAHDTYQDISNDIGQAKPKALHAKEKLSHFTFKDDSSVLGISGGTEAVKSSEKDSFETKQTETNKEDIKSKMAKDDSSNKSIDNKKLLSMFIAPDVIDEHYNIMQNLKKFETNLQPIKTDPRNKKCRFDLQKAINVPINALSSNSGSQIKSKINRLLTILSGKAPDLMKYDFRSDSAVYSFCFYLVAKQFVEQGDSQISAQHSTAFPIALAVLGVWSQKPEVGPLILGHFYACCPYLVPYYPPRKEGQSDSEYFEVLGYRFDDTGSIEPKYKFLSRMSGYMRLYAAIMVSPLPPNVKGPHPHSLPHGWQWISRTLNLEPRVDITATMLFDFLEVAGHSLQKTYANQFKKLLHILCKDYFLKIKQLTPGGSGPVERLEIFLQQTMRKGIISPPDDACKIPCLSAVAWRWKTVFLSLPQCKETLFSPPSDDRQALFPSSKPCSIFTSSHLLGMVPE